MLVKTLCVGFGCALLSMAVQAAEKPNWLDIESRIQYSYYTEDVRALDNVMELLGPSDSDSALRRYYVGLANYRSSQLDVRQRQKSGEGGREACVDNLDAGGEAAEVTPRKAWRWSRPASSCWRACKRGGRRSRPPKAAR